MIYTPPLIPAKLLRRYKRFLADVELTPTAQRGSEPQALTAHCANPGSMRGLIEEGGEAWLFDSQNPKRKLPYSLELLKLSSGALVCVNTARANTLMAEALSDQRLEPFKGLEAQAEVKWAGEHASRFDFALREPGADEWSGYLEVKSATLSLEGGVGAFPDAVTTRGLKHLEALLEVKRSGLRAVLCFVVMRDDVQRFRVASEIDPAYAEGLQRAIAGGVEVYVYACSLCPQAGLELTGEQLDVLGGQ